ncbi:FAD-dependent oxidoreductase [Microcella humidisoli]|uniref:Cholesterol oxidase n=1 Tax=Microcella humidisoli TaxID=2963406 RepID=A0ABY5FYW8_9MICO|nr:GMC family oxidoreductase [Microcella humidisoli]UTT63526.1 GMC family oxidoreductase [Microcella humidisoli]
MSETTHTDVLVIGSGFGGSVAALRLVEKGYSVTVLEAGRRFADDEFATTSWSLKKFFWAPALGLLGIQRIHLLDDVMILAGAGVGGGSLVYANTLYRPASDAFFTDRQWAHITDWKAELDAYYDQASRMLGVALNPTITPADEIMQKVAADLGVSDSFHLTPVGVYFGEGAGVEAPDPYFGGAGPARRGCIECGECMTGCRHNAKNTLVKNYLHLAESAGAVVHPLTTVTRVEPRAGGSYTVTTRRTGKGRRTERTWSADQVVVAAGAWGTQQLLHRMKAEGHLPGISDRLGELTRTNSEALGGASTGLRHSRGVDMTRGVAITSSIHPDEHTHVEPCRYGHGSNALALLATVAVPGGGRTPRWLRWIGQLLRHPGRVFSMIFGIGSWSRRSIVGLVMQNRDNSLTVRAGRGPFGGFRLRSSQGHGEPNPTYIPQANEAYELMATHMNGYAQTGISEVFDVPMTAHFLGGCPIGDSSETGVVDAYHRVFGHEGLHVVDGAAISANLGVNPSLTITAQAERAFALWPNRGEADARPALGTAYVPVPPVPPASPVVPAGAVGELRLPVSLGLPRVRARAAH